jgi:integrase
LNAALSKGMRQISILTEIPGLTYYSARHTFGNLARNKCRLPKDDVAQALNHVDHGRKTTDIYLEKDWTIVDEVQNAVLNLLRENDEKLTKKPVVNVRYLFEQIDLPFLKTGI